MIAFSLNCQESSGDDLDDLFDNADDVEERIVTEVDEAGTDRSINLASLSIPLKMSGNLSAEVGAAYIWNDKYSSGSAYFDLENYLYFTTRPDKYMSLKGSLKTSLPGDGEAEADGQNHYFYLYELYFDYIMANRFYLTAGKKKTVWGNVRLFSNDEDFEGDEDALYTNALYDSRYNISGIIRIPVDFLTFNLVTMYRGQLEEPTYRDMSFAGSLEAVIANTYFTVFGRTFPSKYGNLPEEYHRPILGAEAKRTLLGFDVYGQMLGRPESTKTMREVWKRHLYHIHSFDKFTFTGGIYRFWNEITPYIGFNAEYQVIYSPVEYIPVATIKDDDGKDVEIKKKIHKNNFENRFMVDFGMAKLGKSRNIKVGLQWYHNITHCSGYLKPGVIISRIFPHCDWRNGVQWEYGGSYDVGKFTFGSYFKISLGY